MVSEDQEHKRVKCAERLFFITTPHSWNGTFFFLFWNLNCGYRSAAQVEFTTLIEVITTFIQKGISAKKWYLKTSLTTGIKKAKTSEKILNMRFPLHDLLQLFMQFASCEQQASF